VNWWLSWALLAGALLLQAAGLLWLLIADRRDRS
jgi:hypothetical protein